MDTRIVEVTLPNKTTALVRAVDVDGVGASKTGFRDRFDFGEVASMLEGSATACGRHWTRRRPAR
jgi:hypothetical protein